MEDKKTEEHVSLRIPLELHTQILEQFPNERTKAGKYLAFIRSRIQMDQNVYKSQEEVPTGLTLDQVRDLIQEELASLEIPSGEDITTIATNVIDTRSKKLLDTIQSKLNPFIDNIKMLEDRVDILSASPANSTESIFSDVELPQGEPDDSPSVDT